MLVTPGRGKFQISVNIGLSLFLPQQRVLCYRDVAGGCCSETKHVGPSFDPVIWINGSETSVVLTYCRHTHHTNIHVRILVVANNISPIPISEKKKKYIDTYNQTAKKAQMQMASGTTEIVTLLENSLHLSSLCLTLCQFYSFKLAYSCQQRPWRRQLWIHIFARFTTSGGKGSSEPKLFEKLGKALIGLPWVIWLTINQLVWTEIGNYYWSSLSHMPTLVAKREGF